MSDFFLVGGRFKSYNPKTEKRLLSTTQKAQAFRSLSNNIQKISNNVIFARF